MFIASIETRHFDIEAYGATETDAIEALGKAWSRHQGQYPDAGSLAEQGDITVREAILGRQGATARRCSLAAQKLAIWRSKLSDR